MCPHRYTMGTYLSVPSVPPPSLVEKHFDE